MMASLWVSKRARTCATRPPTPNVGSRSPALSRRRGSRGSRIGSEEAAGRVGIANCPLYVFARDSAKREVKHTKVAEGGGNVTTMARSKPGGTRFPGAHMLIKRG